MSVVVEMDEFHDSYMASKRAKKQKDLVIKLSPDCEEVVELEVDFGISVPIYANIKCCMDPWTIFKWEYLYYLFKEETFPEIPLLPRDTNPYKSVYQSIKQS
jgi:hypothetical protein